MTIYYKATRPDGRSFTGNIDYIPGLNGEKIRHPRPVRGHEDAAHYLSISVEAGDCTGFRWPARLFEVKPVGRPWTPHPDSLPNKRAVAALTVVRELPAHMLFGPQGEAVVAIIDRFAKLTARQKDALYAKRAPDWFGAYRAVAGDGRAARAGLRAARDALRDRLGGWSGGGLATYGAALAVLLRHTIGQKDGLTQTEYDTLTAPWVAVTKERAHPEDVTY